jgi:hypothetical protein
MNGTGNTEVSISSIGVKMWRKNAQKLALMHTIDSCEKINRGDRKW